MSEKLEQYLKDKRESLDVENPDDLAIWDKIRTEMQNAPASGKTKKPVLRIKLWDIAAVTLILLSLGYVANDLLHGKFKKKEITLSEISSDLGRREQEYNSLINLKEGEIRAKTLTDNEVIKQLFDEISKLDTVYNQAMKDLRIIGPDDRIINTIFSTYEQKIRLLELIVLETNKTQSHENNKKINL